MNDNLTQKLDFILEHLSAGTVKPDTTSTRKKYPGKKLTSPTGYQVKVSTLYMYRPKYELIIEFGTANSNKVSVYKKRYDGYGTTYIGGIVPLDDDDFKKFINGIVSDLKSIIHASSFKDDLEYELGYFLTHFKKLSRFKYRQ